MHLLALSLNEKYHNIRTIPYTQSYNSVILEYSAAVVRFDLIYSWPAYR